MGIRNANSTTDFKLSGLVRGYDQSGLLASLALTTFGSQRNDTYHFVCTFSEEETHAATCTLTFEEPNRAQGPAWVTAKFRDVKLVPAEEGLPNCIAQGVTIIGSYPFSSVTDDAGIYVMNAVLERSLRTPSVHESLTLTAAGFANILIVYAPDGNGQTGQLANAIADGATSASADVKVLMVQEANYARDVYRWADAV